MVFFFFPGNRQVVGSPGNKEWNGDSHMKPGSTSVKKQIGGKKTHPKKADLKENYLSWLCL